jgi:ribose transport system substrate-binding protein
MKRGGGWRHVVGLLSVTGLAVMLVGVGPGTGGAAPAGLNVIVIVKATNSQYWQYVFAGARKAVADMGAQGSYLGASAESDIAGQISITEDAISRHPAALIIAPTAAKPLVAPIERATSAGIPVIVIDSSVETTKYASFLATDNEAAGRLAADQLAAFIKQTKGSAAGKVAYLTALPGVGSLTARDKGFTEELQKFPGLKVVDHRYGNNDAAQSLNNTTDILTKNPDLAGIFADNNMMGDGAGRALQEKSLAGKVALVAFDTDDQELAFLKSGVIDALIVQDPYMMGYAGVMYGIMAHYGAALPKALDTGVYAVTKANMASPQIAGLLDYKARVLRPFLGR